ncbi:haloacid dehalogenase-like hydrolase domain-containing protein [Scenedesmus sp. PABB004]|nr:haloacid dehalogenase-like hydrolase domain-containing protein [Scenedesmus sp. PABB004]
MCVSLLLLARVVEPVYGSTEFLKLVLLVDGAACAATFVMAFLIFLAAPAERKGRTLYTQFTGFHGVLAGLLVAVKQIMPDHEVVLGGMLRLRARYFPSAYVLTVTALALLSRAWAALPFLWFGTYAAWLYLRFFQAQPETSLRGDPSEDFKFSSFFPDALAPPLDAAGGLLSRALRLRRDGGGPDARALLPTSALLGGSSADANRRRERGAKALEERLEMKKLADAPALESAAAAAASGLPGSGDGGAQLAKAAMQARCSCSGRAAVFRGARPLSAPSAPRRASRRGAVQARAAMQALVLDCDGVILESEDLHRRAYNAAFENFDVRVSGAVVNWSESFYDVLQNTVGGGKPKMRWYFGREGWPTSSVLGGRVPASEEEQALLVDTLQEWKSDKYRQMVGSGEVPARPGILRLMDDARAAGLKVAVCSAGTKDSVIFTLTSMLGPERFAALDCFLAGDDVDKKKPDPAIYALAASQLGVPPGDCVVVEDSMIGLRAALGAGMRCVITYTPSTREEEFPGAERIVADVASAGVTIPELMARRIVQDDRVEFSVTDSALLFGSPQRGSGAM